MQPRPERRGQRSVGHSWPPPAPIPVIVLELVRMILILDGPTRRSNMTSHRWRGACAVLVVVAGACGGATDTRAVDGALHIVATTGILGDIVSNVVGDLAEVEVLIPDGADLHDYRASSSQVAAVHDADLVVANGLLLEEGLTDVLEAAEDDGARIIAIGALLDPIPLGSAGPLDPHVWMDPIRMAEAARLIATELTAVRAGVDWAARAELYAGELMALDAEIVTILAAIPNDSRDLVTYHDSLGYFAQRYGFDIVGVVVGGGSTLAGVSSAELADLITTIETRGVSALFAEIGESSELPEAVVSEVDHPIEVVHLHVGSLGEPGSGADSLVGMLRINARLIAEALS